jgi:hypothetical protein
MPKRPRKEPVPPKRPEPVEAPPKQAPAPLAKKFPMPDANETLRAMPPVPLYGDPPCPCALCVSARAEGFV